MTLAFLVLIQYRSVTDGQTDGRTDIRPLAIPAVCIARYANALVKTHTDFYPYRCKIFTDSRNFFTAAFSSTFAMRDPLPCLMGGRHQPDRCICPNAERSHHGGAEFAGQENDGQKNFRGWKLQDWNMTDKSAGLENAGLENDGQCSR